MAPPRLFCRSLWCHITQAAQTTAPDIAVGGRAREREEGWEGAGGNACLPALNMPAKKTFFFYYPLISVLTSNPKNWREVKRRKKKKHDFFLKLRTLECTGSDLCALAVAVECRQPKNQINSALMLGRKNFSPLFLFFRHPSIKGRRDALSVHTRAAGSVIWSLQGNG